MNLRPPTPTFDAYVEGRGGGSRRLLQHLPTHQPRHVAARLGRENFDIAIKNGYIQRMNVSIADAKNRLPELIRAVEGGETVIITRHGRPVAQLGPAPRPPRKVRLGLMKGRIRLSPGWDAPVDLDHFLAGDL